jgi:hypothetical protein
VRGSGGEFYQFAFTRREVRAFLERRGFVVRGFHPYDPARILRKALPALVTRRVGVGSGGEPGAGFEAGGGWRSRLRRLLYTEPALRFLGHMILAVATKPGRS